MYTSDAHLEIGESSNLSSITFFVSYVRVRGIDTHACISSELGRVGSLAGVWLMFLWGRGTRDTTR